MAVGKLIHGGVTGECGHQVDAAFIEQFFNDEPVAADVVFTQQVDFEFRVHDRVIQAHDMGKNSVVGNVMAGGLTYALIAFTGESKNVDAQLFLHLPCHGMDIVADQPHRTGGEDGDGLGFKNVIGFLDGRFQFLFPAEHNILVLHVRGKAVGHIIVGFFRWGTSLVAPGQPGVKSAADGAVG